MGVSIRAYARHRGVSHVAVQKAIKTGRIASEPDGTIDPVKADAAWTRSTDPAKAAARAEPRAPEPPPAATPLRVPEPPSTAVPPRAAEAPAGGMSFVQARTGHEIAKAHLARLRLQERKGELVDRARATALVFRLAREERDAWASWPARVAALIAAELGLDAHTVQTVLEAHVRAHLNDLADVAPDLR